MSEKVFKRLSSNRQRFLDEAKCESGMAWQGEKFLNLLWDSVQVCFLSIIHIILI